MKSSQQPLLAASRQSPIGVVSLVSSGVSFVMIIGVFPLMSFLDRAKVEIPEPWKSIGIMYMPLAALLSFVAVVTGITGLLVKNRRKEGALIGLIVGGVSMLIFVGIVALVFMTMSRNSS